MISIILPTYNERDNIIDLIRAIDNHVSSEKEIIVVDDNSPDGTSTLVQHEIETGAVQNLRLETRKTNRGLTNSIKRGIELSKGEIVVWLDCDFSMPPELIPTLVNKILVEGYDIAVGSRFIHGGSFKKDLKNTQDSLLSVILSRLMNYAIQFLLDNRFKDYTSGFIAIKKNALNTIFFSGDYGEYFIFLMTKAILQGFSFIEIPYECLPRKKGESKTGSNLPQLLSRGIKYILMLIKMVSLRMKHKIGAP